jgi:hypothetical protein
MAHAEMKRPTVRTVVESIGRFFAHYASDMTLWPVLFVIVGHLIIVIAPLMTHAWKYGSTGAFVGLALFAVVSALIVVYGERRRALFAGVVGMWCVCGLAAFAGNHYDIL